MKRLPSAVIAKWGKLKHDLLPAIDALRDVRITDEDKAKQKRAVKELYEEFDSGLSAKCKKASTAKDDDDAKEALEKVLQVVATYKNAVNAKKSGWTVDAHGIANKFLKALRDIEVACNAALAEID